MPGAQPRRNRGFRYAGAGSLIEPERLQIELVAYDSAVPAERDVYA